jgi:small subunit ribosomal protein S18
MALRKKPRKPTTFPRYNLAPKKYCYFCKEMVDYIDFKNAKLLGKYVTRYAKIEPRRRSGTCAKHQRLLSNAIKRSRFMALLPFVPY